MTDRELMQEAWETLNLVLAPFPVDDQRCLRVARMLEKRLKQLEVQSTHSNDCWRWHHECAIAKIERMAQPEQEPVGDEWTPCMKLPVVVHVRKQRFGEAHVSTREGITPVKPDDLIMRGVSGEEYPIGRAIFEQTYSLNTTPPQPAPPPECQTEEEKTAFAFGWMKAMEAQRLAQPEQEFIKHHGDDEGWSEWVCPDPDGYLMKCCDCGLVHEAEFGVVRYKSETEREDCDRVDDPNLQAVFRMRRSEQWSPEDTAHRAGGMPMAQPEQEPKPEPALSKKHLRIGDLWRKHDGK